MSLCRFSIELLTNKSVDILFGLAVAESGSSVVDYSLFHIMDAAVWWVPIAAPIPDWQHIIKVYQNIVWLLILLAVLANGLTWWLADKLKCTKMNSYTKFIPSLLRCYLILLQISVIQPRNKFGRALFIFWTYTTILLFTAYQSQLISILTKPIYENQISNTQELLNSNLKLSAVLVSNNQTLISKLYNSKKEIIRCPLDEYCLNRTAFNRDMATVKTLKFGKYFLSKYYTNSEGKTFIVDFKDHMFIVLPKYCFRKGFPFVDKFNEILLLLQSNGLITKWEKDLMPPDYEIKDSDIKRPLTTQHLQGPFYFFILGNICSFCVFLGELMYRKLMSLIWNIHNL